jgi:AraC-like DNA-binding protein
VWIEHDGSRPFVADSSVVPLYNAGHPYKRRQIDPHGDRTDWFSVTTPLLREMLAAHGSRSADADRRLFDADFSRVDSRTFLSQRGVIQHVQCDDPADTLFVEESVIGILDQVLVSISKRTPTSHAKPQHRELAEHARAHLNRTFARRDGLTALACALQSSVFHLCRVFREHAGLTIHQYRSQLRLRKSLELLGESRDDILTTAIALGYSGHSHFTGAFHRSFGVTPSEFRTLSARHRLALTASSKARSTLS